MPLLDNNQLNAVRLGQGPALIVAGPGSGKTKVLTHHIKYLIEEQNVLSSRILVITFSRAASAEMKSRFNQLMPKQYDVNFGTFHSVYYKLLKLYSFNVRNIIDEKKRHEILSKIIKDTDDFDFVSSKISYIKSRINHNDFGITNEYIKILDEYNETLKSLNLMDYDDILINTYEMINNNEEIRNNIKNLFDHILVDEFQDINEYQYMILKLISNGNLFAVGDDDQSIYGFRGADGGLMKRFLEDYSNVTVINLNVNYRSLDSIVNASELVIKDNHNRLKQENCIPHNISNEKGVYIRKCLEYMEINNVLLEDISKVVSEYSSVALLVRTNKEVMRFRKLIYNDIDYRLMEYEKSVINCFSYYLDFISNNNIDSLFRILNIPNRYIPVNVIKNIRNLDEMEKILRGKYCYNEVSILLRHMNALKRSVPFSFALYMENIVGIKNYYMEKAVIDDCNEGNRIFNYIKDIAKESIDLKDFYHKIEKLKDTQNKACNDENQKIKIMTFHASKGLEFDVCLIPDVIEGKIPGHGNYGAMDVEEERRLFYVAMTRAKKKLFIYTVKKEESAATLPSRFLNNLLNYSSSNSKSSNHSSNLSNTASSSSSSSIYDNSGSSLGLSGFSL